jgi:hypothetical protein
MMLLESGLVAVAVAVTAIRFYLITTGKGER